MRRSDAMYPYTILRSKEADSPPPPPPKKTRMPTSRHVDRHSSPYQGITPMCYLTVTGAVAAWARRA